jgi:DNA-binding response OmpR family regulator
VLRRTPDVAKVSDEAITIGKLTVNLKKYSAHEGEKEIKMSHKEFEIIRYLIEHVNETVDRDDLMSNVWGIDYEITTRTVDNFILKLRQKIEENSNNPKYIHTVHGIGYKLTL